MSADYWLQTDAGDRWRAFAKVSWLDEATWPTEEFYWRGSDADPGDALCCDLHGRNCEPPSELCCRECPESGHDATGARSGTHADGTVCSSPDLSGVRP